VTRNQSVSVRAVVTLALGSVSARVLMRFTLRSGTTMSELTYDRDVKLIFTIEVALSRPPKVDEYRQVVMTATNDPVGDWQTACLLASRGGVMPVSSELTVEY
jgi:hypothetical protein